MPKRTTAGSGRVFREQSLTGQRLADRETTAGPSADNIDRLVDLTEYRESEIEQERIADLLELAACERNTAIDVGTRDGYFARLLADRFRQVTALDLEAPPVGDERVTCVAGDVRKLEFPDDAFDLVVCAEVLEHIPPHELAAACAELSRITRGHLLIGVPYKQDTRVGRTTCVRCGTHNPP